MLSNLQETVTVINWDSFCSYKIFSLAEWNEIDLIFSAE